MIVKSTRLEFGIRALKELTAKQARLAEHRKRRELMKRMDLLGHETISLNVPKEKERSVSKNTRSLSPSPSTACAIVSSRNSQNTVPRCKHDIVLIMQPESDKNGEKKPRRSIRSLQCGKQKYEWITGTASSSKEEVQDYTFCLFSGKGSTNLSMKQSKTVIPRFQDTNSKMVDPPIYLLRHNSNVRARRSEGKSLTKHTD